MRRKETGVETERSQKEWKDGVFDGWRDGVSETISSPGTISSKVNEQCYGI